MVSVEYQEGISEVLDILKHMDKIYTNKIPEKFMNFLTENQSQTYKPKFNHSKNLNQLDIKEKTKDILGVIYLNYWSNEEEKKAYINKLKDNQEKYQLKAREKYNPNSIFDNSNNNIEGAVYSNLNAMPVNKKDINTSFFNKIINKIKNIFKK